METQTLDSIHLPSIIEEKLATGANFKKVKKELLNQGYDKRDVDFVIKSSDQYRVYSAYSVFYALAILVTIYSAILLSTSDPIIFGIVLVIGILYAAFGILTSRGYVIALYAGISLMTFVLLVNLLGLNIIAVILNAFFLSIAVKGINPMKRILAKGQKVTRTF